MFQEKSPHKETTIKEQLITRKTHEANGRENVFRILTPR